MKERSSPGLCHAVASLSLAPHSHTHTKKRYTNYTQLTGVSTTPYRCRVSVMVSGCLLSFATYSSHANCYTLHKPQGINCSLVTPLVRNRRFGRVVYPYTIVILSTRVKCAHTPRILLKI